MTAPAAPAGSVRGVRSSPVGVVVRHALSAAAMLALMLPAWIDDHASVAAIGAMFALFAWAAVAGAVARRRIAEGRPAVRGRVADPFAMALLMAVPYLPFMISGHAHGGGTPASGGQTPAGATLLLGVLVIVGWAVLRLRGNRRGSADPGFWICLVMMVGMVTLGHAGA